MTIGFQPEAICRHSPGDPDCSSTPGYRSDGRYSSYGNGSSDSPDASKYHIVDAARVGNHLVLKVEYPNCASCAYEGNKVMVFLNVTEAQVLKWRKIDPHFRAQAPSPTEAPSPAARFPASKEGWDDAVEYAQRKSR